MRNRADGKRRDLSRFSGVSGIVGFAGRKGRDRVQDDGLQRVDRFHHRRRMLWMIAGLAGILLALLLLAMVTGRDMERADYAQGLFFTLFLSGLIAGPLWVLRRDPVALRIGPEGIELSFAFSRPLGWSDIHRIRRETGGGGLYGRRDWLIVDPSPGVLAPIRLRSWRRLDLWFQGKHGVRIPLHGLEGDPERVVASVERFRPVTVVAG